jgi:hypothetical protein
MSGESVDRTAERGTASGPALTLGAALGLVGAALGVGIWTYATLQTGLYKAYLAPLCALGAGIGVRIVLGGGWAPQLIGLAVTLPAIAAGQYLGVCALWRDAAVRRGDTLVPGFLVPFDMFLEGWRRLADPGREVIFLVVSVVLVLWLLRWRPPVAKRMGLDTPG